LLCCASFTRLLFRAVVVLIEATLVESWDHPPNAQRDILIIYLFFIFQKSLCRLLSLRAFRIKFKIGRGVILMVKTGFCATEISTPSPYQGHCSPIVRNLLNCSKTCKAQDVLYFRAAVFKASDTLYLRFDGRYTSAGYA
jgi:hypothetical protein